MHLMHSTSYSSIFRPHRHRCFLGMGMSCGCGIGQYHGWSLNATSAQFQFLRQPPKTAGNRQSRSAVHGPSGVLILVRDRAQDYRDDPPPRHVGVTTARGLDISRTMASGARLSKVRAAHGEPQP